RKYSGILFGMCLKYSRNKIEAEDNLHDSFITIYNKIGQYNFKGSFEGWIKRVTINTVLQKYRKEQYMDVVTENFGEESDVIQLDTEELDVNLNTLLGHIQELPNKYRITFNLYVLDGYSHKEISEMLGTSTGTSKSNLARAKMILREKIKKENINIA
ncbi:MAG: sigma-70 family RNA polymerase sigma factor, partial [Bacteroidota bacterium]